MLSVLSPTKKVQHLTIEGFRSECEIPAGRSGLPRGSRRKQSNLAISNLTIRDASIQIRNGHDAGFPDSVIIDSLSSSAFHSRCPLLCLFFRSNFFDSLDALVPDYLDAISIDLMDAPPSLRCGKSPYLQRGKGLCRFRRCRRKTRSPRRQQRNRHLPRRCCGIAHEFNSTISESSPSRTTAKNTVIPIGKAPRLARLKSDW